MATHSKTPWRVEVRKDNVADGTEEMEMVYGSIYATPETPDLNGWCVARIWSDYGASAEDARRIVAAINACQGITTARLEEYGLGGLSKALWEKPTKKRTRR